MRVAILGTGGMARAHVSAYHDMADVEVVAGVDTNPERLEAFLAEHQISNGFASVDDLLAWGEFDAVSNVTPDGVHRVTTLPLLKAGKHVLCEKPLATTEEEALEMAQTADASGVVNMVNLTYRNVPALMEAARLIEAGAIGEIRHFEASYFQSWLTQPLWGDWRTESQWLWRLSQAHGSLGVLGDVGVHILDFTTHAIGSNVKRVSANLATFDKAEGGRIGEYELDANDTAIMQLVLENGAAGVVHTTRFASGHINDLRLKVFGTKGGLDVRFENFESMLLGCLETDLQAAKWTELETPAVATNYVRFIAACREGAKVAPDFERGAALQAVIDRAVDSDAKDAAFLPV